MVLFSHKQNRYCYSVVKKIFDDLDISQISSNDRFMFCGSMGLNNDLKKILLDLGLCEGANNNPAEFVLEKAFVG